MIIMEIDLIDAERSCLARNAITNDILASFITSTHPRCTSRLKGLPLPPSIREVTVLRNHCGLHHCHPHLYCHGHRLSGRGPRASHRNTLRSESLAAPYRSPSLRGHQLQPILQTGAPLDADGHPSCVRTFCVPKARHRSPPSRCCSHDFCAWLSTEFPSWRGRVYATHCLGKGTDGKVGRRWCSNISRIEVYSHLSCRMYDSLLQ